MSNKKSYTFSLSRWHAVANRIAALADQRSREAIDALGNTHVNVALEADQLATMRRRGARALENIALARLAYATIGAIRSRLAVLNAETGVSVLLAEQAALSRQASLLRQVAEIDATRTPLEVVNARLSAGAATAQASDARAYMMGVARSGIPVALVDAAQIEAAGVERAQYAARIAAISDQVNDLNARKISIEIPESLAKEVGLEEVLSDKKA